MRRRLDKRALAIDENSLLAQTIPAWPLVSCRLAVGAPVGRKICGRGNALASARRRLMKMPSAPMLPKWPRPLST